MRGVCVNTREFMGCAAVEGHESVNSPDMAKDHMSAVKPRLMSVVRSAA